MTPKQMLFFYSKLNKCKYSIQIASVTDLNIHI